MDYLSAININQNDIIMSLIAVTIKVLRQPLVKIICRSCIKMNEKWRKSLLNRIGNKEEIQEKPRMTKIRILLSQFA